jgi:hypothetical protein
MEKDGKRYQALLVEMVNLDRERRIKISGQDLPPEFYGSARGTMPFNILFRKSTMKLRSHFFSK